jgi:hypothetical protein
MRQGRRGGTRLYQRQDGTWKKVHKDENAGFAIFDDPPISVKVGGEGEYSDQLTILRPGETWDYENCAQDAGETSLPDNAGAGDAFKYVIKSAVVDWWD